jgi:MFS family permease
VASGLNIAAFNIGIALGASLGGLVVEHIGLMHTPWLGALVVVGAALTALSGRLDRRDGIDRAPTALPPPRIDHMQCTAAGMHTVPAYPPSALSPWSFP